MKYPAEIDNDLGCEAGAMPNKSNVEELSKAIDSIRDITQHLKDFMSRSGVSMDEVDEKMGCEPKKPQDLCLVSVLNYGHSDIRRETSKIHTMINRIESALK